jgi:uncharacterized protein YoxC
MDEEAKKLLRDLLESLRRSGSDGLIGNINRLSDSANSAADNLDSVERSSKGIKKNQDELAKDFKTFGKRDLGDLKYKLENSAREVKEFARSVRDAEERVQNSTNATERANAQASLASKKSHLDEIATRQRILERNVNAHIDYVDSIEDAVIFFGKIRRMRDDYKNSPLFSKAVKVSDINYYLEGSDEERCLRYLRQVPNSEIDGILSNFDQYINFINKL